MSRLSREIELEEIALDLSLSRDVSLGLLNESPRHSINQDLFLFFLKFGK